MCQIAVVKKEKCRGPEFENEEGGWDALLAVRKR